jgi:hypothetical protein
LGAGASVDPGRFIPSLPGPAGIPPCRISEMVDDDTVSFPSHAAEFGYDGDLVVDYTGSGEVVTFDAALPGACVDACTDAYAWALSAFSSGPWERGEVP